ncbi:hypothetical protein ACVCAH_35890 [Micromonospora sp. LZ34]
MFLAALVTVLAFLVWLTVARLRWLSVVVLAVLALLAAATVTLAAVQPRAAVEARLLLFLGVAATLIVGRWVQRRRLGGGDRVRWRWPYRIGVGLALVIACGCMPALAWDVNDDGFVPSVREVGPLPGGLAIRGTGSDPECGTGGCAASYRLVGQPGEPADQVARRFWDHLVGQGWPAPTGGRSCRPVGWLLDTRETCVVISTAEGVARLGLEGGRPYPRYTELR